MSRDCNIYGGFVAGSGGSTEAVWGSISGEISNQTDLIEKLNHKVDKEQGKDLSSNDFTNENKDKLDKLNTIFEFSLNLILSDRIETAKSQIEAWSCISRITTSNSKVTVYCYDSSPTIEIPIQIICIR